MATNKIAEILQQRIKYNEKYIENNRQWAGEVKEKFNSYIERIGRLEAENKDLKEAIEKLKAK